MVSDLEQDKAANGCNISEAFCIGVGPFADARVWNAGHAYVETCMGQLVCFLDIVEICS